MKNVGSIVVVVNRSADADYVLQKAAAIAETSPQGVAVHVVRVIFEDFVEQVVHLDDEQGQALKLYLMQAEEEFLVDLVEDYRSRFVDIETTTLWNKRVSDAVLNVAETFDADLIIKSADPESPYFPRHPDDWNLLRQARSPVFLVKPEPWPKHPLVLAAVDVADIAHQEMNAKVIAAGASMAKSMAGPLHVVNALPQGSPLLMSADLGVNFERLERDIEQATRHQLLDLLNTIEVDVQQLHLKFGQPAGVVADVAVENDAAVVVVGTAGRKGVSAIVIGNTSEKLLHTLHQDLLVLHV
jgi:universal stress protein E